MSPFSAGGLAPSALTMLSGLALGLGSSSLLRRDDRHHDLPAVGTDALFMRHIPAVAWSVDRKLHVVSSAGGEGALFGLHFKTEDDITITDLVEPRNRSQFEMEHRAALAGSIRTFEGLYFQRYYRFALEPARDHHGMIVGVKGVALDISEMHDLQEQLLRERHIDDLTGLATRMRLYDRLGQAMIMSARNNKNVGVLAIDIDRFKLVNETSGHEVGDLLLRGVADRLLTLLRRADTVARLGSDDFAAVLFDIDAAESGAAVAGKLVSAFQQPFLIHGEQMYATVSIGVAISPYDGEDENVLLRNAETALSFAKVNGGNAFHFYTNSMHDTISERVALEGALRVAIANKEIQTHYQPLISRGGTVIGFEALARWDHPTLGRLPPVKFIPLAEETGLIVALGELVLRQACYDINILRRETGLDLHVAVNISARQFDEPKFVQSIIDIIDETGINPHDLELELTESMLMRNMDAAIAILASIKTTGASIAIDDFGTGYSSLSHLKRLPIDTLKIDQSFVRELPQDADAEAIVTAIASLAHALGLKVIAEGVETPGQLDALLSVECDFFQGYFFGRPAPISEILATFRDLAIYKRAEERNSNQSERAKGHGNAKD